MIILIKSIIGYIVVYTAVFIAAWKITEPQ